MANQKGKSGMSLADRDKKVLLILASICVVALAWFLGFQKFNEKRIEIVEENQQLEKEVRELQRKVSKRASIEEDTAKKQAAIDKVLLRYPTEVRTQTVIERLDQVEKKIKDVTIETEAFNMNQIFFQGGAVLDTLVTQETAQEQANADNNQNNEANAGGNGTAQAEETAQGNSAEGASSQSFIGYRSDTNITFSTNYEKLKKILNFLNSYPERTNVREVNVTSEEGSKPLKCTMSVSMYSVGGREGDYKDPSVDVTVGKKKDGIFK